MEKKKPAAAELQETSYTKDQLLRSERYRADRDLMAALLQDGSAYSATEVEKTIKEFKERKVK